MSELDQRQLKQIADNLGEVSAVVLGLQEKRRTAGQKMVMGWVGTIASVAVVCVMMLGAFERSIQRVSLLKEENLINRLRLLIQEDKVTQADIDKKQDLMIQKNTQAIELWQDRWARFDP